MWTRCAFIVEMLADGVQYDEHWALFGKAIHLSAAILSNTNKTIRIDGCCCCYSSNDLTQEKWSLQTGNFIQKKHYTFTHTINTTNKKTIPGVGWRKKCWQWHWRLKKRITACHYYLLAGEIIREKKPRVRAVTQVTGVTGAPNYNFFVVFFSFNYHCPGSI